MVDHPAETAFESHDDQQMVALWKEHARHVVADADEVRNTDLSGQFGGIYVRSLDASFKLDTEDLQADDGVNVIIDDAGNHFVRLAVSTSEVDKYITAVSDVTLDDEEQADNIFVKNTSGAPINVYVPSAEVRTKTIRVYDDNNNAGTYAITLLPKSGSGQTILGGSSWSIDSNSSSIQIKPKADGSGYL